MYRIENLKILKHPIQKSLLRAILFVAAVLFVQTTFAQSKIVYPDCSAKLENGILSLENSRIIRTYQWNEGNLISRSLTDKASGKVWLMTGNKPDLVLPGETEKAVNVVFASKVVDETAGRRGGYHYLNEYGNLFLENRYTDWTNYYPYTTLRNLWMLSKYVPAEKFQGNTARPTSREYFPNRR